VGVLGLLLAALAVAAVLSVVVGPTSVSLAEAFREPSGRAGEILFRIRLPWVFMAIAAGAGLSVVGVSYQAMLRNPLADPFLLGMSGGASLGVVAASLLGLASPSGGPAFGFAGALLATLLVWRLSRVCGQTDNYSLLLAGVVVNAILSAAIMLLMSLSRPEQLHNTALWLMGVLDVFQVRMPVLVTAAALVLGGSLILSALGKHLNLLSLGESSARHLGANLDRLRWVVLVAGAVVVGAVTAIAGPIGFVGLLVPHLLRLMVGADHRLLVPACAIGGAVFLLIAGSLARVAFAVAGTQIPVGVITACTGGPFFLWLLRRRGELYRWHHGA